MHIIVSRHAASIQFCQDKAAKLGLGELPVLAIATTDDVRGKHVLGNLPLSLACLAASVYAIEFTGGPPRGHEYSLADMLAAGAQLQRYAVLRLDLIYDSPSICYLA